MSGSDQVLVECHEVGRSYGRGEAEVLALRGVSCRIRRGQRIALTGESGSGKSTVLHLMAGLEPPTSGTLAWPGLPVRGGRVRGVALAFQAPSLLPMLDVADNVALPLLMDDVPPPLARERALAVLDRLHMGQLSGSSPEELSGGQGQRVAIARALAAEPALLLADEPTGQLDRRTADHVLGVLIETVDTVGAALVISTHDPAVAARLDEQWVMSDGRLAEPADVGAAR